MVLWRFFGPGGSIRQLHQLGREERLAEGRAFFLLEFWKLEMDWCESFLKGNKTNARRRAKYPVENSVKNHKKIIQKVVDLSVLSAYNRDSS